MLSFVFLGVSPHVKDRNWTVADWMAARCWPPTCLSIAPSLIYFPSLFVLFHNLLDTESPYRITSLNRNDCKWHIKEMVIRLWPLMHVTHLHWQLPAPTSLSNVLGMVGGEGVRRGLEVWNEGLEDSVFNVNLQIYCLFQVEWNWSHPFSIPRLWWCYFKAFVEANSPCLCLNWSFLSAID